MNTLTVMIFGRTHTIVDVIGYHQNIMVVTLDNGMEAMVPKSLAMVR